MNPFVANIFFHSIGYRKCIGVKSKGITSCGGLFSGSLFFHRYPIYPGLLSYGSFFFGVTILLIMEGSCVLPTIKNVVPPYLLTVALCFSSSPGEYFLFLKKPVI